MRTFTEKQNQPQKRSSCSLARSRTAAPEPRNEDRILTLQRAIGNQAVRRMLQPSVQRACACGGKCPKCQNEKAGQGQELSVAESGSVQRAPAEESRPEGEGTTELDYQYLVKAGKWCRDSEDSGALHPGEQCYREIPSSPGYPSAKQVCFSTTTGEFIENSPDYVSAVSGQKAAGTSAESRVSRWESPCPSTIWTPVWEPCSSRRSWDSSPGSSLRAGCLY